MLFLLQKSCILWIITFFCSLVNGTGYPFSISAYVDPVKQSLINQKPERLMNNSFVLLSN